MIENINIVFGTGFAISWAMCGLLTTARGRPGTTTLSLWDLVDIAVAEYDSQIEHMMETTCRTQQAGQTGGGDL